MLPLLRIFRRPIWVWLLLLSLANADDSSCNKELASLQRRVAQIEQLLNIGAAEDEASFMQHVLDYNMEGTSVSAIRCFSISVLAVKNGRQSLQTTILLAVATSNNQLTLYTENGGKVLQVPLPTVCKVDSIEYESGDENLLAIAGCESVLIASLAAWKDVAAADIKASISFEDNLLLASGSIASLHLQNHRFLKQAIVGTDQAEILVYTRNGTLKHQATIPGGARKVIVKQQRPRQLSYATPTEVGFVRMQSWSFSPEICNLDNDDDEISSFVHNPKQSSIVYAATRRGRLLVFDTNYNRRNDNSCGLRFSMKIDPGFGLSISAVPDFVFAASSKSLFVLNVTGDPLLKPRIAFSTALNFTDSESVPLLSVTSIKHHVRLNVAQRGGTQVRAFSLKLMPDTISQSFSLPRAPIFLFIMFGTVVYQLGKRKLAKRDSELSEDDKRMIDAIIKRSQFDKDEVRDDKQYASTGNSRELRHRLIGANLRQGEVTPARQLSESSGEDEDFDEERRKKTN